MNLENLRQEIITKKHTDEHQLVSHFLASPAMSNAQRSLAMEQARELVNLSREDKSGQGPLDSFLLEFGLSNKEGVALMCLAESLLRVPDSTSADRLIAEKIQSGDWASHLGHSDSVFVNASTWGLLLTGKLVQLDAKICSEPGSWVKRLSGRVGEPVVRAAFFQAMKLMGQHYVLGRTIQEGLSRDTKLDQGEPLYSFDMLGEAARTQADAMRYYRSYANAIEVIGQSGISDSAQLSNGISVKLSALHPRYELVQKKRVMSELYPRIKALCIQASKYQMGLSIDAEEAARLDLSLDIFQALATDPELSGWQGLGFVLQAYQKRAPAVAHWLIGLAKKTGNRLMVRLVKGAYWDYEIKHAQEQGLDDYPVFTRKSHTDLCYLHCAKKLLLAPDQIYAQFATHNAYTAAAVLQLALSPKATADFEFQRLHGMGDLLYKHIASKYGKNTIPLRVYAPIGRHEDLLPYLVRRLLENGANSSFVNRFLDSDTPVEELISDLYADIEPVIHHRHSNIPVPENIYIAKGENRVNSNGIDLDCPSELRRIAEMLRSSSDHFLRAGCLVDGELCGMSAAPIFNPMNFQIPIGEALLADDRIIDSAIESASQSREHWGELPVARRSEVLKQMADSIEAQRDDLIRLITMEAGRTVADAVSEVREAADFCRYYAMQGENIFSKEDGLVPCGVFLCISPWNFPLAIFVGQVAAALISGNAVIAKPAAQTPAIAFAAVKMFHAAGVPSDALHLLTGSGSKIGNRLLSDSRLSGVCFTGSTETAKAINAQLAARPGSSIPFIAETGGQNCLIADSTALPEQLVDDVIASAFQSAGQRCSALRVLFIQSEIADKTLEMLKGAMQCLEIGNPASLSTDVGPVIDSAAVATLEAHARSIEPGSKGKIELDTKTSSHTLNGSFFAPRVFEIENLSQLSEEVFGPILHVIRYHADDLDAVIEQINDTGFGLTLGIHSRIEAFSDYVIANTNVGNNYINRNMVGAVVGVNPFGGMGLSGTGPKAGGPNYLYRFCMPAQAKTVDTPSREVEFLETSPTRSQGGVAALSTEAIFWRRQIGTQKTLQLADQIFFDASLWKGVSESETDLMRQSLVSSVFARELPGPTGEENVLFEIGRGQVAVLLTDAEDREISLSILLPLIAGCAVTVFASREIVSKVDRISEQLTRMGWHPGTLQALAIEEAKTYLREQYARAVICCGGVAPKDIRALLANQPGPLVPVLDIPLGIQIGSMEMLAHLLVCLKAEKTRTENLVARGGNTALFCLEDDQVKEPDDCQVISAQCQARL